MLTAERGIYELAAGNDPEPYIRALEKCAGGIGLIPEQVWDAPDLPERHFVFGGETGAAMPLVWAHAEYIKLCRSAADGKNSDLIEPVYDRYVRNHQERPAIEIWKSNRQIAETVKVDHKTVAVIRTEQERTGEIPQFKGRSHSVGCGIVNRGNRRSMPARISSMVRSSLCMASAIC